MTYAIPIHTIRFEAASWQALQVYMHLSCVSAFTGIDTLLRLPYLPKSDDVQWMKKLANVDE
jgi:hypothetical protein